MAFSISYFGLQSFLDYTTIRSLAYCTTVFVMFLLGYNWIQINKRDGNNASMLAIKLIYIGLAIYIVGCLLYTFGTGHVLEAFSREPFIFWDGTQGNSTHFSSLSAIPIAVASFESLNESGRKKIFNIIILLSVFVCNLLMANRVSIVFMAVFLLLGIYLKNKDKGLTRKLKTIVTILGLIVGGYIVYTFNLCNVQMLLMKIPVFKRSVTLNANGYEDPRLERQLYVLKNFGKHLWGGGYYNAEVGEVHNVWLDIYDYAGIIPFILFLIFTIIIIVKLIVNLKKVKYDSILPLFIMTIGGFLLSFTEEPVFRSCESYTVLFFFVCGLFFSYIRTNHRI